MPLLETKGAASAQGFGMTLQQGPVNYIEDVFQTWLYTGNGSTQTINNGIDLAGKGGLVWVKNRNNVLNHELFDTVRGTNSALISNGTFAAQTYGPYAFNANGFGYGSGYIGNANTNGLTYVSWTFREQPKFFDVVTYTGNGTNQTLNHNLGSVPGCMIVKSTSATGAWYVYHRSADFSGFGASGSALILNSSAAVAGSGQYWAFTSPTATQFTVGAFSGESILTNIAGVQYVAYLFAHNAGGFGLSGTDNVISCGSFTSNGNGAASVNLGYEPQWIMYKDTTNTGEGWIMIDNMRGFLATGGLSAFLRANTDAAEVANALFMGLNSTGFSSANNQFAPNTPYIYIAIRRGPMRTPTTGTSVFAPFYASYSEGAAITTNFPIDLSMWKGNLNYNWSWQDRLRGTPTSTGSGGPALASNSTAAETTSFTSVGIARLDSNIGGSVSYQADSGRSNQAAYFMFRRAPGFFDEVCYTGTGASSQTYSHNLGATPELMIVKSRNTGVTDWAVYNSTIGATNYLWLNTSDPSQSFSTIWNNTAPTSSVFTVGSNGQTGGSGRTYVAYLFASCPGVSRVGSYTGNGSTQQINCGFTGGARFVMIKQTSGSGGDWVVYSSALGINAGTDSYVLFNSNTGVNAFGDTIDAFSAGFELGPNSSGNGTNENGQTYIFLAIA